MAKKGIVRFENSDGLSPGVIEKLNYNFQNLSAGNTDNSVKVNATQSIDLEQLRAQAREAMANYIAINDAATMVFGYLLEVEQDWDEIEGYVDSAQSTLIDIKGLAVDARTEANNAHTAAMAANEYAIGAGMSLSEVERVVGTLNWIAEHGEYVAATETSPDNSRVYYTRTGTSPNYKYSVVTEVEPTDNPAANGWYYLMVDESVQNYIASHIAQTDYGLDLMIDDSDFRIHIGSIDGNSAIGTYIIDNAGIVVSSFGSDGVCVGSLLDIHVEIRGNRMSFLSPGYTLPDDMTGVSYSDPLPGEVAFISIDPSTGESLFYMTRTIVLKTMRFGSWRWSERSSGNMSLRWIV